MMKEGIPVSIVLPTYNRAGKIGNAIESVLRSTYPHFELLIIDDGSVDETETVVSSYQDKRIKYYKMSQNGGQSKARNYDMPTLLVKKECIKAVGYLDESLQSLEDYDFALRLAQRYKAIFLDEIL